MLSLCKYNSGFAQHGRYRMKKSEMKEKICNEFENIKAHPQLVKKLMLWAVGGVGSHLRASVLKYRL